MNMLIGIGVQSYSHKKSKYKISPAIGTALKIIGR